MIPTSALPQFAREHDAWTPVADTVTDATLVGDRWYTLNETGNVMVVSATPDLDASPELITLFRKAVVFFGAVTAALARAGRSALDHAALDGALRGSGQVAQLQRDEREIRLRGKKVVLGTAIVEQVLEGLSPTGGALAIARSVLGTLGSQLRQESASQHERREVGHLLIVCESIAGMSLVSIMLFAVRAAEAEEIVKANCHEKLKQEMRFRYRRDVLLFVDPHDIEAFGDDFRGTAGYEDLVGRLQTGLPTAHG